MLVFIDESGDAGFKLDKGSSPVFVVAIIIFADNETCADAAQRIEQLRQELGVKPEWKFSKCKPDYRDRFFQTAVSLPFTVRAIVVQKSLIRSDRLKTVKEDFYRFFVKTMMRFDNGTLQNARVIIDGSGDRVFRTSLKSHLRRHCPPGSIADVRFKNSKSDSLVQLADMAAGAIARSYREERTDRNRWRQALDPKIDDIWEFM